MIIIKNHTKKFYAVLSLLMYVNSSLNAMATLVPAHQKNAVAPVAKRSSELEIGDFLEIVEILKDQEKHSPAPDPTAQANALLNEFHDLLKLMDTNNPQDFDLVDDKTKQGQLNVIFYKEDGGLVAQQTLSKEAAVQLKALMSQKKEIVKDVDNRNNELSFLKFYELIKGLQEKEKKDYQEALEKWNQNNQTTPAPDQPNIEFKKILDAMKHGNFNDLLLDRSKADAYKLTLRNKNIPNLDTETILSKDTSEALGTLLNNKEMQKNIIQNNRNALNKNTKQGGSKGSGGNRSGLSGQKNQKNNNGYFGDDTKDSKKDKDEKKKKGLGGPIAWPDQSSSGHQPSQNYGGSNYNYGGGGRSGGGYRPSSGGYYGGGYDGYAGGSGAGRSQPLAFTGAGGGGSASSSRSGKEEKVVPTKGGHEVTRFDSAPYEYKKRTKKEIDNLENYFWGKSTKKETVSRPNRYSEAVKKSSQLEATKKNKEDNNVTDRQKSDSTKNQKGGIVATITDVISTCVNSVISFFNWLYESTSSYF